MLDDHVNTFCLAFGVFHGSGRYVEDGKFGDGCTWGLIDDGNQALVFIITFEGQIFARE
jgi:hypothetical protein